MRVLTALTVRAVRRRSALRQLAKPVAIPSIFRRHTVHVVDDEITDRNLGRFEL